MIGSDFIRLAGRLCLADSKDEASIRTSVSRSYYGALHLAIAFIKGISPNLLSRNDSVHQDVYRLLIASKEPAAQQAGSLLSHLRSDRNKADYDLDNASVESQSFAMICLENARDIESILQQCETSEVRERIRLGIQSYLGKLKRPTE